MKTINGADFDPQHFAWSIDGKVATITINRPERMNALHWMANEELATVFNEFVADPELWVAIITGAGDRAFSAGNDLKYQAQEAGGEMKAGPKAGFGGLTGFVLVSKKDFSFMRGFLSAATLIVLGILVIGWLMGDGFGSGLLMSGAILLLFAGWVLHDTSVIQKHLPLSGYVFGATMLFIDFVVILRQVVFLLMALADND